MTRACSLACVIALASCKGDAAGGDRCERMAALAERCAGPDIPSSTFSEMRMYCFSILSHPHTATGSARSLEDEIAAALEDCTRATTCAEQNACFARQGCSYLLQGPGDRTPQFNCWPKPSP